MNRVHRWTWTVIAILAAVTAVPFIAVICLWLYLAMIPPLIVHTFKIVRTYGD